jgi:3-(3-hydroxy-phenyl)propionate hydroxylase
MEQEGVLIVGGGPVGLTTAWLLAEGGIPVTVLEKVAEVQKDYRASTFHAATLDLFEGTGITEALVNMGLQCPVTQFRGWKEGKVAEFDHAVLKNDTRHPYRLQCEQYKLAEHLFAALGSHRNATLLYQHEVTGISDKGGHVEVTARSPRDEHRFNARYAIAADGGRSTVRHQLGIAFEGKTYPERILVMGTPFDFKSFFPDLREVNYISDPGNYAHILRIPDLWRMSLPLIDDTPDEVALTDDYIYGRLRRLMPAIGTPPLPVRGVYSAHQRVATTYRKGRIFLAGDAAHLNNPKGGMGLNGGLQDAYSLSKRLCKVWKGEAPETELDGYEAQRRPEAMDAILAQTDQNVANLQADEAAREKLFAEYRRKAADPALARQFLLQSSMIASLRRCGMID